MFVKLVRSDVFAVLLRWHCCQLDLRNDTSICAGTSFALTLQHSIQVKLRALALCPKHGTHEILERILGSNPTIVLEPNRVRPGGMSRKRERTHWPAGAASRLWSAKHDTRWRRALRKGADITRLLRQGFVWHYYQPFSTLWVFKMADPDLTDEADALGAIFGDDIHIQWRHTSTSSSAVAAEFEIRLQSYDASRVAKLVALLLNGYPKDVKPQISIRANQGLSERQRLALTEAAGAAIRDAPFGSVCVYEVASAVQKCLDELSPDPSTDSHSSSTATCRITPRTLEPTQLHFSKEPACFDISSSNPRAAVKIIDGERIADRKSIFQAFLARGISSAAQLDWARRTLLQRPKIAKATHNMYAYRYINKSNAVVCADHGDDGEDGAGKKIALLFELFEVTDALIMCSRWYGGIKLGPDRFKHIAKLTQCMLELNGYRRRS